MSLRKVLSLALPSDPAGDGKGDGSGPAPDLVKVTLQGGVIVSLPKPEAEAYFAAQTKHNAERDDLARKVGAAEAERKAAEDRAAAEARDKEAMKLAKDGEIAKARELLTAESNARFSKVAERAKRQEIEATIRRLAPGLDAAAVSDMVSLVTPRAVFDADTGAVQFVDDSGKPAATKDGKTADASAFLTDFLAARKHFQPAKVPAPTGGDPPANGGEVGTIRLADVARMTRAQAALMVAGKLRVIE